MRKLDLLKEHATGIIIAVVVGLIIALPPIVFRWSSDYQGFDMLKTNTEAHYVAQVQEVYDGHLALGNPFFADLKNEPYLFPPIGPLVIGLIGRFLGLGAIEAVMLLRFVITSAMAFFIYLFTRELASNKWAGLIAAPFVMLGYSLLDPSYILEFFRDPSRAADFIDYGRPVNPQFSSLLFFAYLFFFWRALHRLDKSSWRYALVSVLILGASFYTYLFTWTFILSLNGFLSLVYISQKDWTRVKRIVGISAGAAILGLPYLLHVLDVSRHPWYAESARRFGFVALRVPNVSRMIVAITILFIVVRKWFARPSRLFFIAFFSTAFFVVNEQLITGQYVFNHHYHWYYSTPLAIVFLSVTAVTLIDRAIRKERWQREICLVLVLLFLSHGVARQVNAYKTVLGEMKREQRYAALFSWLNQNTPKDTTVFASEKISNYLPALTHNNVYYHGTGIYTLVPDERLSHGYLLYNYLDGVATSSAREFMDRDRGHISAFVFGYTYSFIPGVCYGCFPDQFFDQLVARYQSITDDRFIAELKKYQVDYIVWDRQANPTWRVDRFGLPIAVEFNSGQVVYEVK